MGDLGDHLRNVLKHADPVTLDDVRATAEGRRRRRARRMWATVGGAAVLAVLAVGLVVMIGRPGEGGRQLRTASPPADVTLPNEDVVALTEGAVLEELTPAGTFVRRIASPDEVQHCYSPTPGSGCPVVGNQPIYQASLAYDAATRAVMVSAGSTGEIDAFPLDGAAPSFVAYGEDPAVSSNGRLLAFTTGGAQLAAGTIAIEDLMTGQLTSYRLSAISVAEAAGLPDAATAEDSAISSMSWAPDDRHLAATFSISFGLNAANSIGTTFDEVIDLDTARPTSATNPRFVGPPASTMTDLRTPSNGRGWADVTWLGGSEHLVVYDPESGTLNATPFRLKVVDVPAGGVVDTAVLDQPPAPHNGLTESGGILGADPTGQAVLVLGDGAPNLEAWTPTAGDTYRLLAPDVVGATWVPSTEAP